MELFKLLGTIAIENAEAKKALQETGQEGEKAESKLSKAFGSIGKGAAVVGKTIAKGLLAGVGACVGLATAAIKSYGDYEQLVGGVETLFGTRGAKSIQEYADMVGKSVKDVEAEFGMLQQAQSKVMENASNAYKTAGMSVNEYMESVNGIAAALNQSSASQLESAELADQAVIDMSDNAAKMGTSMEAIQNAYAGFSKQNYTMLDNLKLGYGGTKEEMQRLLKDAEKISGIKYDISSFADVTQAIHVMQEEMGIAGTTAKEASGTIQGSFGMLKGSWSNLMTGLSDPSADLQSLISNVFESATTFAGNLVPRITQVLQGIATSFKQLVPALAGEIPNLFNQVLPAIVEGAVALVDGLVSALPGVLSAIQSVLPDLIQGAMQILTGIIDAIIAALPLLIDGCMMLVDGLIGALPQIMQSIIAALPTLIPALIDGFIALVMGIVQAISQIVMPLVEALPQIIVLIVEALVQNLPVLIEGLIQLIMGIVTALPQIIQALVDALPTVISLLIQAILTNLPAIIEGLIQVVMGIVTALPEILGSLISAIPAALKGVWDGISQVFSGLGDWFGKKFKSAKDAAVNAWSDAKEKFNKAKDKVVDAFTNLKDKVGTKFSEAKEKAQQKWSDAKEKFNKVKDKVVDAFSNLKDKVSPLFSKAKENATQTWSTVKGSFEKIKNGDIVGAFSDLGSLLKGKFSTALDTAKKGFDKVKQIGKDLISGLWNGIDNKFDWLTKKIKSFAKKVTDKLKSFFGIKSPSRVFRDEIGKQLADGVAVGIDENTENAESAAETMGKKVLEAAQKRLDDYKVYNDLTLADEVAFWDKVRVQCEEGTDARIQADKKFLDAKKSLNDEIASADETLQTTLDGIYQRIEERATEIKDSFGLFDIFSVESTDGLDMFASMNSQVQALESYQAEMEELKGKIGDTDLYAEIESMGVNALNSVKALNDMSDYSLQYYLDMYNKRSELAKGIASSELQDETQAETEQAYKDYADRMAGLGVDIVEETEAMKTGAVNNLKAMLDEFTAALQSFSPKMKLPHFTIQGSLDLETGSVPTVSVEWFKKAMNNAMILDKPTIFGYNTANGNYLGAGDAGSEVVAGSTTLMNMIQSAVEQQNSGLTYYLQRIIEMLASFFPEQIDAFRNMKLQLNTGALVGELVVPMDQALGKLSTRKDRGR